jgi:glycosyltransferase involved in cell wall biosynthesis
MFVVPGRLETRTGGYEYDRRIAAGLRARGWVVDVRELDPSFPTPTTDARAGAARVLAAAADGTPVIVDGLAFGAMPEQAEQEGRRLRLVAVVHLPLAEAVGLDADARARFEESERRAVGAAALVVATGGSTVDVMRRYGVASERLVLVEPGVDPAPIASGSHGEGIELLSVASLVPGKGHGVLIEALSGLKDRSWHLTCAGSLTRDRATAQRLRAAVRSNGLEDRVSLVGELDEAALARRYDAADVFVLATRRETYGMAVAEALARGLPIVSTDTGAIPALVGDRAGLIVSADDAHALAGALALMMDDPDVRRRLAQGAKRVRARLPTWEAASTRFAEALDRIARHV